MTYKVGDRIRIVRIHDQYKNTEHYGEYIEMVGNSYNITAIHDDGVSIDAGRHGWYRYDEIEPDKNYIVTEILKDL